VLIIVFRLIISLIERISSIYFPSNILLLLPFDFQLPFLFLVSKLPPEPKV